MGLGNEVFATNEEVGITLMAGEEANAIVELLTEQIGDDLRVTDGRTYVKVETSIGELEITFAEVCEVLGRRFDLSDFQMIFASYYGRPSVTDQMIGVYASMSAGIVDPDGDL